MLFNMDNAKQDRNGRELAGLAEGTERPQLRICKRAESELSEEVGFYCFQQYLFEKQWKKLKAYANKKGIKIIGDVPIYVALDSADVWANPELFQIDEECQVQRLLQAVRRMHFLLRASCGKSSL